MLNASKNIKIYMAKSETDCSYKVCNQFVLRFDVKNYTLQY